MEHARRTPSTIIGVVVTALLAGPVSGGQRDGTSPPGVRNEGEDRKPSLSLKANPASGFSPLHVRVVAELRGGSDDYQDLYCPTIEWDWGDGTMSENTEDCEPYQDGRSAIRRRFSADHTYRGGDAYRLVLRLKQKSKVVAMSAVPIQVRAGLRDDF